MIKRLLLGMFCALASALAQSSYTETILHSLAPGPPLGASPSTIARDSSGNLYGAAYSGGAWNQGSVYKLDPDGNLTILHNFTGGTDGAYPGPLILDAEGNLYGTTYGGGLTCAVSIGGCGVAYKIAHSGKFGIVHSFGEEKQDGFYPIGGLSRDAAGNLYGVTLYGGIDGMGIAYKLSPSGAETVLHSFAGGKDGASPIDSRLFDGALYGVTACGGPGVLLSYCSSGAGVVFKIDASGHETVLYGFTGNADGASPQSLTLDPSGNIYGTTAYGGSAPQNAGGGVVFKLNPTGDETVLHAFLCGETDGCRPAGPLYLDLSGNLYGVTPYSGQGLGDSQGGVVFKVTAAGQESVLHFFTGTPDGANPNGGVVSDSSGTLYGSTQNGGSANHGALFSIDSSGAENILYSFPGSIDGSNPIAGLVRDSAGNFYGTTNRGGTANAGTVYKIAVDGAYTVLHEFTGKSDGGNPGSAPIIDPAGSLYGTTTGGGKYSKGVVYTINPASSERVLYSFTGGVDGSDPVGPVFLDAAGILYGTTAQGGANGLGVVFQLSPQGHETVLYSFTDGENQEGEYPQSGVVRDAAGNLFGTTQEGGGSGGCYPFSCGVVYKLDPSGKYTVLHKFTGQSDGGDAYAGVILDSSGNLYGTTYLGGNSGCQRLRSCGVVYKVDPSGHETVLYSFNGTTDGCNPIGGVVRDAAGNLYGTTGDCGLPANSSGRGVVFELTPAGDEIVLHTFTGPPDGNTPWAGVILDPLGNLYGTTYNGGQQTAGVVFQLAAQ